MLIASRLASWISRLVPFVVFVRAIKVDDSLYHGVLLSKIKIKFSGDS